MITECGFCKKNIKILPSEWELEDYRKLQLKRINAPDGFGMKNNNNSRFELCRCKKCGTFWESRPLYEETMYGGEPGEMVKVSDEYVKEHYPEVKI
jgi:hypothetical protein